MQCTLAPAPRKGRASVKRAAVFEPTGRGQGRLTITAGNATVVYRLTEIGSDIGGRGFQLSKAQADGGDVYHVLIADEVATSCDCCGWLAHSRCKHVDALQAVLDSGELPPLDPEPEPPAAILDPLPPRHAPRDCEIILGDISHPCPSCGLREADERGYPCDVCKREIQQDMARLSYNGRFDRHDVEQGEQQHAA